MDTLVASTGALMRKLVPGTTVDRCGLLASARVAAQYPERTHRIALPERQVLVVVAPRADDGCEVLKAVAELVELRVDALTEKVMLRDSVEQLGRSERLQRALYAIADQASAAGTDLASMFQALHRIVGTLMYAENFYIALYDREHERVRFAYYADAVDTDLPRPDDELPFSEIANGPTWHVIRRATPLRGSMEVIGKQIAEPLSGIGVAPKDWLGVPLLRGGAAVGCVVVQSYDDTHHYDGEDQSLLTFVAQHIQTALGRRMAHAELERRVQERTVALSEANRVLQQEVLERQRGEHLQAALFQIAELAGTTDSIEDFYAAAHRVVSDLLYARNFYVALLSDDGAELTFPYWADERNDDFAPRRLSEGHGMTEYVVRKGSAVLADEQEIARLHASGVVKVRSSGAVHWLGVPLVCDERTVGVLVVQSYSRERRYSQQDRELLTFVSYHIANALARIRAKDSLHRTLVQLETRVEERTCELAMANRGLRVEIAERERVEARLEHAALHDSLTDLPNRALFMQRLTLALARYHDDPAQGFAVLFVDLDRFKIINDSEGHLVGDGLLIQAGARIRACVKVEDVVARLGGDEFGVLLEGVRDTSAACRIAERIIGDLNGPFRVAAKELFTSASAGVTLAAAHYRNPEELLRDADSAMYRAKAGGRHRCVVFDDRLRDEAVLLLEVENDLRRGMTRGELVPYYQPIVDLANGRVVGYEALMRWRHPQRGVLLPGAFLDVAEDTGTLEAIDWQIFTQVCRDANALSANNDLFVSVNLSAHHFGNPRFEEQLLGLLDEFNVPPARLWVEVTERTLLENTPSVKGTLEAFRRAGIHISLDDFGTGYSSLSYLSRYPIQVLKIDRSFITSLTEAPDCTNDAVIRAILAMAATLSLQVIAEGVETQEQCDRLRQLGCRYIQGFLYAKAHPVDAWIGAAPRVTPLTGHECALAGTAIAETSTCASTAAFG
ncbi:MAG: EAL domain-containing protein [Rhodanobacteraceae bacterium]